MRLIQGDAELSGEIPDFLHPILPFLRGGREEPVSGGHIDPVGNVDIHMAEARVINALHLRAYRTLSEENVNGSGNIHADSSYRLACHCVCKCGSLEGCGAGP